MRVPEAEVQRAVAVMREIAPWDSGRETIWQFQARQARAILEDRQEAQE